MMGRKGFVSSTGHAERLHANDVRNMSNFVMFARQELGVKVPIGGKERGVFAAWMEQEMRLQGWALEDLVAAVVYCKDNPKVRLHHVKGVLYYVDEARSQKKDETVQELRVRVAEALNTETDPTWVRRLSLAQGRALELVYDQWMSHA